MPPTSGATSTPLTLAFTGDTGFELDGTLSLSMLASAHSGTSVVSTDTVTVLATNAGPSFGSGSVAAKSYRPGSALAEFQVPAATGGNGALAYSASNLPTGLAFDADGTGACSGTEPREISGTPRHKRWGRNIADGWHHPRHGPRHCARRLAEVQVSPLAGTRAAPARAPRC